MRPELVRHLPARHGEAPSEMELRAFEQARAALQQHQGKLPSFLFWPGVAVAVVPLFDGIGLAVEVAR